MYCCTKCWTRQSNFFLPLSACTCSVCSSRRQSANHLLSKILSLPLIRSLQRGRVRLQVRGCSGAGAGAGAEPRGRARPRSGTRAASASSDALPRLPDHEQRNNEPPQLFGTAHHPYLALKWAVVVLKLECLMKCS